MNYKSTRDSSNQVTASQAILQGLATDGGLYVPTQFPQIEIDWDKASHYSYQEMAQLILQAFLSDFSSEELKECIQNAYDDKFDDASIAPLVKVGENYVLELFHGPTIAFKDMALSILPYLMKTAARINNNQKESVILTATSGDTGKAAMAGFADVPGTKIIVFYPQGGVSSIQEQQMLTQKGDNTYVVSIKGNFDDAQTKVKELFNDHDLKDTLSQHGAQFSSANSINIGRLLPQVVYYYYAYAQLIAQGVIKAGDPVNFDVPTGNFGNILAGFYAKKSGLAINKLICASNDNKVLFDFFQTGTYNRNRPFELTLSPSMDILVSSNFERLVYHAIGEDSQALNQLMDDLKSQGKYSVKEEAFHEQFNDFLAAYANDAETQEEIKIVFEENDYIMDPHTAVAARALRKITDHEKLEGPVVILSTASPYKFPEAVLSALDYNASNMTDQEKLGKLHEVSQVPFPQAVDGLLEAEILHNTTIEVEEMRSQVLDIIIND